MKRVGVPGVEEVEQELLCDEHVVLHKEVAVGFILVQNIGRVSGGRARRIKEVESVRLLVKVGG